VAREQACVNIERDIDKGLIVRSQTPINGMKTLQHDGFGHCCCAQDVVLSFESCRA
jgi:hypothetical protein